jgi:hypothetical protein
VIRSIEIEKPTGIPDRIIVSETRLEAGRSYSEEEIRQAVYRIRRLPFVDRATYRLIEAESGSYRLMLTVRPTHRFTANLDLSATFDQRISEGILQPDVNFRHFFGDANLGSIDVGTTGHSGGGGGNPLNIALNYTGYDLFAKRVVVEASLSKQVAFGGPSGSLAPSIRVVFPLTQLQSIVGSYVRTGEAHETNFSTLSAKISIDGRIGQLFWTRDTTDDPFFALRGTSVEAGVRSSTLEGHFPFFTLKPLQVGIADENLIETGVRATATHFVPLWTRAAVYGTAQLDSFRTRDEFPTFTRRSKTLEATGDLVAAYNFGPPPGMPESAAGRIRIEGGLAYRTSRTQANGRSINDNATGFTAAYVYRHPWARVRISVIYYGR